MCQTATWEPWRRLLVSSVLMCDSIFFKSLNSPFFKLLLFFFTRFSVQTSLRMYETVLL